jgi:hypothetical protein
MTHRAILFSWQESVYTRNGWRGARILRATAGVRRRPELQRLLREKYDARRTAHRGVFASERELASVAVDTIGGQGVTPLIARNQETSGGIDHEAARIIASGPRLPLTTQPAGGADIEDTDRIVKTVGSVNESAVLRNPDFRGEFVPTKPWGQGGNHLWLAERSVRRVVVEQNDGGCLFLYRIEPAPVGMEDKMVRPISRRHVDRHAPRFSA